jgi:hypothetical protein
MNGQSPALKQLAVAAFLRLWLVFSAVTVFGVVISSVSEQQNPLTSDDPHIIGFVFAFTATGLALIYSIADSFRRLARYRHWITATALAVWCISLALAELFTEGEVDGWSIFIAVGSLVASAVAWPLCALHPPAWIRLLISTAGLLSVAAYAYVVLRMSNVR